MCSYLECVLISLLWIHTAKPMSLINQQSYFMDASAVDNDVADLMLSKGYLPNEKDLPRTSIVKNVDNDVTYLLSKLSDEELIRLLNDQPKKEIYDLKDVVKVATDDDKLLRDNNNLILSFDEPKLSDSYKSKRFRTVSDRGQSIDNSQNNIRGQSNDRNQMNEIKQEKTGDAYFRLDDKRVDPFSTKSDIDANYAALQKINNLLYARPQEELPSSGEEDERKELLFDVLVAQLKTLCCKRSKSPKTRDFKKEPHKSLLNEIVPQKYYSKHHGSDLIAPNEYMFLIINDEIKGNGSEELISVDPESLEKNSSVLLLGPITTPLTNTQLKAVMTRISKELTKPDYVPLLQQISDGTLTGSNIRLMKSLLTGPDTRRYVKPHRCNHQSPLAKVYGGPKWIICTGYLNLNTPSLYD